MADAGCDVWMGNVRGNTYSTNHTTLKKHDKRFWQFTFDEMAGIDLPSMIDYVLAQTGVETVSYFGHSQGTLIAFIGFSQNKELASKINVFGALAPVARITHIEGMVKWLSVIEPELQNLMALLGYNDFAPSNWIMQELAALVCPLEASLICKDFMFVLCGYDQSNLNSTRVPVYVAHTPAGTSTRNIIHWAQLLRDKMLQKYDYGSEKLNMQHYNSSTPPQYDITTLNVPTALLAGGNDFLADPRDVAWLEGQLNPGVLIKNVFYDDYNHMDFVWAMDANRRIYDSLVALVPGLGSWF